MARLRRPRTSSQTSSRTADPSHRPDSGDPQQDSHHSSSSRPRSPPSVQGASPASADPTTSENTSPLENTSTPENTSTSSPNKKATIRFYPHQDFHRNTRPSLQFIPISRTLPSDHCVIRVGRYSERDGVPVANPPGPSGAPVGFKSKVVSRRHCEFMYINNQWHVKDVGSSSGTFLNHMRLSQPNMVSRLYPIKDGDIVQLGIDFRGGEEMIFRCVRMRVECNRSWQQQPNEFNKNTESLIKNLGKGETADYSGCRECSICLGSVLRPYQCLFMAACAHVWHYKCISPLIHSPEYPMFQCPNCRAYTDLSAEVDDTNDVDDKEQRESERGDQMTPEEGDQGERAEPGEAQIQQDTSRLAERAAQESESGVPGTEPEPPGLALHDRQLEIESPRETLNFLDSPEEIPAPAAPTSVPFPGHPHQMDRLASPTLEEALAINFNGLGLGDSITRTESEVPGHSNLPQHVSASGDIACGGNLNVPGSQSASDPTSAAHVRQTHLRSDTPSRSESSEENLLTPRNDSGPLALDGRAVMQ